MNKHTATASDGTVFTRNSEQRVYTHAIATYSADTGKWNCRNWAGSHELALKSAAGMQGHHDKVAVLEATHTVRVKKEKPVLVPTADRPDQGANVTKALYDTVYAAYDFFNKELFDSKLPPVVLLLHRKKNAHGYFWAGQWANPRQRGRKTEANTLAEIALNPHTMGRSLEEVLSTLVHEMVHHEQQCFGTPSKGSHNKEWAEMMDVVGLTPTSTGKPGGKRTGRSVTHMIVKDGPFAKACAKLLKKKGIALNLAAAPAARGPRKKDLSKVKHTCAECGTNIWGKQGITVSCCDEIMREAL